jgi:hypothetical protein
MQHRVLEIGAQELTHRHDVAIETDHKISEGVSGVGSSTLRGVWALTSNDKGMQIAHLGEKVLMVAMESVHRTQAGKLIGQMGMGYFRASPGEPQKATEGSGDRVEHSEGKGIKLLVDKRHDGGAVATEYGLEDRVIGEPYIDALGQPCYGYGVGASADQGQKLCNRCGSTWGIHGGQGIRNEETRFSVFSKKLAKTMPQGQP